jgi:hypothetical protein
VPDYYEDAMGSSATNRDSDANTNGLSDRQEYVWGGTNMGRILGLGLTNNTSLAVKLTALVGADRTYEMVGSSDPDAPFATSVGTFYTGPNGESNTIVDPNGLARGNRFFYRLRSSSPGGALVMTNEETYVWYKQPQYALDSDYIVGVPVNYGTNNTLSGLLGADLARGLAAVGDEFDGGDTLHVLQSNGTFKDFWLLTGNPVTWRESGSGSLATQAIPPGAAVRIKRKLEPSQTANSILAGLQRTNNIGLPINVGWNLVGWPYDSTNSWAWGFTNAAAGGTPATRDQVFLVRNGIYIDVRPVSNNVWKVYGRPGAPTLLTDETYLQPGEALYYRRSGSSDTWTPVIP